MADYPVSIMLRADFHNHHLFIIIYLQCSLIATAIISFGLLPLFQFHMSQYTWIQIYIIFTCTFQGGPENTIQWFKFHFKDNIIIPNMNDDIYPP